MGDFKEKLKTTISNFGLKEKYKINFKCRKLE